MHGNNLRPRPWISRGALLSLVVLVSLSTVTVGQQGGAKWEVLNNKATGNFIVALAQDLQGNIWVGTEDKGVFRYDPKAAEGNQWTQFNSKNGLGDDNAYAIACDKLGRVWVGTLNKGVSVYSGEPGVSAPGAWKNYDVLDGPIGERIFAITTCPTDGDVWLATSAGLTRYSLKNDTWSYVTRADGLPEDQANAIAFDAQGNICVGTQCHGIAMAKAIEEYKKWTVVAGPAQLPVTPSGTGLPTSLINALLVGQNGTIYAGTTAGLAWSKDKGKTWGYLRGRDYDDKVKGRWGGAPAGWKDAPKAVMDTLLPEDYVTCLAEDAAGLLWLGFRQQGYVALDPKTSKPVFQGNKKADGLPDDYVFTILPGADYRPWVGSYGGGVGQAKQALRGPAAKAEAPPPAKPGKEMAALPSPAKPPTLAELQAMLKQIQGLPNTKTAAAYFGEDWTTQGDWLGRYGRQYAVLCAAASPMDHIFSWESDRYGVQGTIGPNHSRGDGIRLWVHWVKTENPRSLYDPAVYYRRQAEWDDHGEAYPGSHEGPDLWVQIVVPDGLHRVSLYIMNKDGHEGNNRHRDYLVEIKPNAEQAAVADRSASLARCRIQAFWGGVYKQFVVKGPSRYQIKIAKNSSFNTMVSAVLLDRILGTPDPYAEQAWPPFLTKTFYKPPEPPAAVSDPTVQEARTVWHALNDAPDRRGVVFADRQSRLIAYRAALGKQADESLLGNWRWKMLLWTEPDRREWRAVMARGAAENKKLNEEKIDK
jgi:frataxin-like iron-binding protein CyaY